MDGGAARNPRRRGQNGGLVKATAYYWLHMLPFIIVMGLSVALMLVSLIFSVLPRRPYWFGVLLTGLFGALLFVSPPFRMFSHSITVGDYRWGQLSQFAASLLPDHLRLQSINYSWIPEFLVGFLLFALARMLVNWLRR
jgi:hypothetical protein